MPIHGRPPPLMPPNKIIHEPPTTSSRTSSYGISAIICCFTVSAAGAVRSGARSVAQFAGTKLSFVSPPTTTSNAKAPTWTTRSCICSRQTECKGIMREWEKLGDEYACMLDYTLLIISLLKQTPRNGAHFTFILTKQLLTLPMQTMHDFIYRYMNNSLDI